MKSKRLPGKALKLINKKPIICICVKRLKNKGHDLIVATSKDKSDNKLVTILKKNRIKFFRGSNNNVLSRFLTIAKKYDPEDFIVRATADNILPDGNLVNLLIKESLNGQLMLTKHFLLSYAIESLQTKYQCSLMFT